VSDGQAIRGCSSEKRMLKSICVVIMYGSWNMWNHATLLMLKH